MKTLFQKESVDEIISRINQLSPGTQRLWGKMNVDQMLEHCALGIETATGDKFYQQVFIGKIIGRFFKFSFMNEAPIKKNGPTHPAMVLPQSTDFETEKIRLAELIRKFYDGGEKKCTSNSHAFFGKLTPQEWARLMFKHVDHHLKQFGV